MKLFLILLAFLVGAVTPMQAGVNSSLQRYCANPMLAGLISFAVGTLTMIVLTVSTRGPLPTMQQASQYPWWVWTGGVMGAFFVISAIFIAPRLGAANMIGFMIAGQMMTSLLLDHYGWLGYASHPVSVLRMVGAAILCLGVLMVYRF